MNSKLQEIVDYLLEFKERPDFSSFTKKKMLVQKGQDRRHIIHGATLIAILITLFLSMLQNQGLEMFKALIDKLLISIKSRVRIQMPKTLIGKVKKVITYAFGKIENLVVGNAIENQGIEKARKSISIIRRELDEYCAFDLQKFADIRKYVLFLINEKIAARTSDGEVAEYRAQILELLKQAIIKAEDEVQIIRILASYEFSCTLDILHNGTSRKQNMNGLKIANRLQQAIRVGDNQTILEILV